MPPILNSNTANTAITVHQKRTYALLEADHPFEIKVLESQKDVDLKQIGYDDFDGQLKHAICAHPKIDRETGEMFAFCYVIGKPLISCSVIDKNRKIIRSYDVEVTSSRMIHDFGITKKYIIIPDLPMEFLPQEAVMNNTFVFDFNSKAKSSYGIYPREDSHGKNIKWFDVETQAVFHFINSWDSKNNLGQDIVILIACVHPTLNIGLKTEHFDSPDMPTQSLTKFEFNMVTGETVQKKLHEFKMEFPIINQDFVGIKNRYCYLAVVEECTHNNMPKNQRDNSFYTGFLKFDLEEEKLVKMVRFGDKMTGGEVFYH